MLLESGIIPISPTGIDELRIYIFRKRVIGLAGYHRDGGYKKMIWYGNHHLLSQRQTFLTFPLAMAT
jgi:hypothetical protein